MTQEEKDLLLKDLCARLPYGVKGLVTFNGNHFMTQHQVEDRTIDGKLYDRFAELQSSWYDNVTIKPYLFPMSSMTEEQKVEFEKMSELDCEYITTQIKNDSPNWTSGLNRVNWLIKNHFDINGLIPKGLAIDATGKYIY